MLEGVEFFLTNKEQHLHFKILNQIMQKGNKNSIEAKEEVSSENSDNVAENKEYIKRLRLQRLVLNKIVSSDINQGTTTSLIDTESTDSNN